MKDLFISISLGLGLLFSGIGLVFFLGFYYSVITGYTLSVLWQWFIVPTLGIPAIGIAQAIGISMTIGYLIGKHKKSDTEKRANKEEKEKQKEERKDMSNKEKYLHILNILFEPILSAATTLLIAWIVRMFM